MKNTLTLLLVISLITLSSFNSPSIEKQQANITTKSSNTFTMFRVHRNGQDKMTCVWSVLSETSIANYIVLKTYNDPLDPYAMWEQIATVAPNGLRVYKITDEPVYPGFISYKIRAVLSNGSFEESTVITEKINARR